MNEIKNDVEYISFAVYLNYPLKAVFSTRIGGVSEGVYSSMNFAFNLGDDREKVAENYNIFAKTLSLDLNNFVLSSQSHTTNIKIVNKDHAGMGVNKPRDYTDVDGLYTEEKNLTIVTYHADCTPIYFYDPVRNAIALAHAGWRGTAGNIVRKMLNIFEERGSKTKDLICAVGPSICGECYQVGDEVLNAMNFDFEIMNFVHYRGISDRPFIDLKKINKEILVQAGVMPENIEVSKECTKCNSKKFFSHRRDSLKRGSNIACMCLPE